MRPWVVAVSVATLVDRRRRAPVASARPVHDRVDSRWQRRRLSLLEPLARRRARPASRRSARSRAACRRSRTPRSRSTRSRTLAASAIALTVVSLSQAISIARAIALRSGQRIDADQEFIGQGLCNVAASFFSGFPTSASVNRSGPNFEVGRADAARRGLRRRCCWRSIVLVFAPLAAYLPLAVMAGSLFLVAWGARRLRSHPRGAAHEPRLDRRDRDDVPRDAAAADRVRRARRRLRLAPPLSVPHVPPDDAQPRPRPAPSVAQVHRRWKATCTSARRRRSCGSKARSTSAR